MMRRALLALTSASAFTFAIVGCGDSGTGGTGGSGTTTSEATTTDTTTATSSSTGMMLQPIGSPCTMNDECDGGLCLVQSSFGWAGGYCTAFCDPMLAPCAVGDCLNAGNFSICVKGCDPAMPADCSGVGQSCEDLSGGMGSPTYYCIGGCMTSADCGAGFKCDTSQTASGQCAPNEVCNNGVDDDGDGAIDCEDTECAADSGCTTTIGNACTGATPLMPGVPTNGTTSGTTSNFSSLCGGSGAPENLYSFTAGSDGFLVASLTTASADLGVSARKTCNDASTEDTCSDAVVGAGTERLIDQVTNGEQVTLFVDGFDASQSGDYTIEATVAPEQDETEPNDSVLTGNAVTIANGVAIVGAATNPTDDQDWFHFTLTSAADVTLETGDFGASKCGADIDTNLELYDAAGLTLIDSNDDISPFGNYCSSMTEMALGAGTYRVHVTKSTLAGATATYQYSLRIFTQ